MLKRGGGPFRPGPGAAGDGADVGTWRVEERRRFGRMLKGDINGGVDVDGALGCLSVSLVYGGELWMRACWSVCRGLAQAGTWT